MDPPVKTQETLRRPRSHREALRHLARRLREVGVCDTEDEAEQLVAVLAVSWPATWSYEADHVGNVDLLRLHA